MKTTGRYIAIALAVILSPTCAAADAAPCVNQAAAQADEFTAQRNLTFPNFCDIPKAPTNVRTAPTFKAAVVRARLAGAAVTSASAPDTFSLADTEHFADEAKREASPPPPMTTPGEANTEEFVAKSKARATPPPKARHR